MHRAWHDGIGGSDAKGMLSAMPGSRIAMVSVPSTTK
jgi:hypothetical protein